MTHKFEGMCIGGPWAGSFRSSLTARMEWRVQSEPAEARMYKIGAYIHHKHEIGGKEIVFWALEFTPLVEVFKELMEGYWRYQDACR